MFLTNKESIKILQNERNELYKILDKSVPYERQHTLVALDMGIEALKMLNALRTEIEKESNLASNMLHWGEAMGLNKALEIIDRHLTELRGDINADDN